MDAQPKVRVKRSRREKLLYSAIALFITVLMVDGVFGAHGLISAYRMKLQVRQEQRKTEQLEQENREFSEQVRELKTDPSAIERVAHQRMGLVKPGELVFQLPRDPSKAAAPAPSSPAQR